MHEVVEFGHCFAVVYRRRRAGLVEVLDCVDPAGDFFGFFVGVFDGVDVYGGGADHVFGLDVFEFEYGFVFGVEARFVENIDT